MIVLPLLQGLGRPQRIHISGVICQVFRVRISSTLKKLSCLVLSSTRLITNLPAFFRKLFQSSSKGGFTRPSHHQVSMGFYGFWMFLDPISVKNVDMGVNPKIKGRPRKWMVKIMGPNPIKNGCFGGLNTPILGSAKKHNQLSVPKLLR